MRGTPSTTVLVALLSSLLISVSATADDAAGCFERRKYDACFREGKRQYANDAYEAAYRAYLEGWNLQRNYEVAGNLGNVELKLGKYRAAYSHLKYSLERLPPSQRDTEVVERLEGKLQEALERIGARRLEVEPVNAMVSIDGASAPHDPDLWLSFHPGVHTLRVERSGYEPVERQLDVRAGQEIVLEIALTPKAPATSGTEGSPDESKAQFGLGLAGLGIGVAGGIASVVVGVVTLGRDADIDLLRDEIAADPHAPRTNPCGPGTVSLTACSDLASAVNSRNTLRATAMGLGIASAGVLLGSTLLLTLPIHDDVAINATGSSLHLMGHF